MSTEPSKSSGRVLLALLTLYLVWGSTYLAMRIAIEGIPPMLMGAIRFLVAGGGLLGLVRWRGAPMPTPRQWRNSALVGALLCAVGNGGVVVAQQWVASSLAAVMVASMPLWAALFAGLAGRWPRSWDWLGLSLGTVGVLVLNLEGDLRGSPLGAALLLLAPAGWALGSVVAIKLDRPQGLMSTAAQMLTGGGAMLLIALAQGDTVTVTPSARALLALLYLIVFGSMVAYSAYGYLLHNVRPALATSYAYVNPVVAVALGVTLGGERVGPAGLFGTVLILAAVAMVALAREHPGAAKAVSLPGPRAG